MKTLKIGIATYEDFKARTLAIAKGELKPNGDDPKIWFESLESMAQILSVKNRELLHVIRDKEPKSLILPFPSSIVSNPAIKRINVDFPEPDAPIKPTISPHSTLRLISFSIG